MRKILIATIILWTVFLVACSNVGSDYTEFNNSAGIQDKSDIVDSQSELLSNEIVDEDTDEWVAINPDGVNIISRINTPNNFTRDEDLQGSFAQFVRNYPLRDNNSQVMLYNGKEKYNQNIHIAVFDMPLLEGDLQQCADSIMRMYAEYYYNQKLFDKICFQFVNGFLCDFKNWSEGYRVDVSGNETLWVKQAEYSESMETFEKYLRMVFSYSSTLSMEKESEVQTIDDIKIGDIFLKSGSPGHVVMVVDVCENAEGEKAFLLAQGYMPAQEFHILKNPKYDNDPWYYVDEVEFPLATPEYTFEEGSLRTLLY